MFFTTDSNLVSELHGNFLSKFKYCLQFDRTSTGWLRCANGLYKLVYFNSRSYYGEIIQLQSALTDDYNNFQEKSSTCNILGPTIRRFFSQKLVLVRSLWSSFINSFRFATLRKVLVSFFVQSCDRYIPLFSFFLILCLDFITISG